MPPLYPHWRDIPIDTHNCHLAITACGELDEAASAMLAALEAITNHHAGVMGGPLITGQGITFKNGVEGIPTIARARAAIALAKAAGITS